MIVYIAGLSYDLAVVSVISTIKNLLTGNQTANLSEYLWADYCPPSSYLYAGSVTLDIIEIAEGGIWKSVMLRH